VMRTTIDVDEKLLPDVIHVTGERRKSRAIGKALE
jgi:Arc/MetJ family transcription regulator